jgi:hypothetical protein
MKRRIFLQRIGSILAGLGVTESLWWTKGSRLQQALADTIPRKLALLVGINQYPQIPALKGCLTDVELQRELLIDRFGFQPSDIMSLTNKQATREGIENAFLEHLVKQAKPGDVVVFHFSGYGSRIKTKSLLGGMENVLIPVDGTQFIDNSDNSEKVANYLLEDTLLLMMQSLATERQLAILDTSYYKPSIWQPTGMRIRSWKAPLEGQFLAEEIEFQKQLTKKIAADKLSVLLASSSNSQDVAKEIIFSDFSAGLFTYALTQYLWETTAAKTIQVSLSRVGSSMLSLGSFQEPVLLEKNNQTQVLGAANFLSKKTLGAEGALTAVEDDGKTVKLWLGGIPPQLLEYYGVNSQFTFYSAASPSTTPLVLRSRNGLQAKATIKQVDDRITPKVGELVRERVRVLPKDIKLKIALDEISLERIERVDATSAFASVERVSSVIAGEQQADYLFAKLPETEVPDTQANNLMAMSSSSRYGLFTLGGELIPDTLGEEGEALKVAVYRLAPKLKTLLAAKLWKLTQNEASSGLSVKATLEVINNNKMSSTLTQRQTRRALGMETSSKNIDNVSSPGIPTVSTGSKVRFRVENTGDRSLYLMLLGLNNSKNPIALYPWYKDNDSEENSSKPELQQVVIAPGETLIVPQTTAGFEWVISGPNFWCETQMILSTAPFTKTLIALDEGKHSSRETHRISPLLNPLEVAKALLQDLNQASIKKDETQNLSADSWVWNVNYWASFNFLFQVV